MVTHIFIVLMFYYIKGNKNNIGIILFYEIKTNILFTMFNGKQRYFLN